MSLFGWNNIFRLIIKMDRYNLDKKLIKYEVATALENNELAEEELDIHILKNPRDEVALCHKAMLFKHRGETDKAIEYLKRAIKAHASYAESRFLLGELYLEMEEYQLARTYLYSGIVMNENTDRLISLGKAYRGLGNDKEAIKCFKKSIKRDKSKREAYEMIIDIYDKSNKDNEVRKYEKLLDEIS